MGFEKLTKKTTLNGTPRWTKSWAPVRNHWTLQVKDDDRARRKWKFETENSPSGARCTGKVEEIRPNYENISRVIVVQSGKCSIFWSIEVNNKAVIAGKIKKQIQWSRNKEAWSKVKGDKTKRRRIWSIEDRK